MNRTVSLIACGVGIGLAASCVQSHTKLDPTYCANNDGDAFCASQHPDGGAAYCVLGSDACLAAAGIVDVDHDGCVSEALPEACWSACGNGTALEDDPACTNTSVAEGSSETGDTSGPSSTEGESDATDTSGPGCTSDTDCTEATAAFCGAQGMCVSCAELAQPDAACAEADAGTPICEAGTCVQCTAAAAEACEGPTPVCGADNGCRGCEEHSECPQSACHLGGDDVGACFERSSVVEVGSTGALEAAVAGLGAGAQKVIVLATGTYNATLSIGDDFEVAVLGDGSPILAGSGSRAVDGYASSLVYLAGVQIVNGSGDGLSCSGAGVWLDDTQVRNNAQSGLDISGGCEAHVRRTVVRSNAAGGISVDGGVLALTNSVVGDNVGTAANAGIRAIGADVSVTYSAVLTNGSFASPTNVECLNETSGSVRNSIIVGADGNSVTGCDSLMFEHSALDSELGSTNESVGAYDSAWFSPTAGDYHLSAIGETTFLDIAQWRDGDPLVDVDGDPIPTDLPSFPGYDQP